MFTMKRVGHVGIHVTEMDRSFKFYTEVVGCTVTGRWPRGEEGELAFLRFGEMHHDLVLFIHPIEVDPKTADQGFNGLNHIAIEVENRDEWFKALAHFRSKGVEIIEGPLVHGLEGGQGIGGSGSRSFYFLDPDGNRLEIYTEMMRVPNGEQFPRPEYARALER